MSPDDRDWKISRDESHTLMPDAKMMHASGEMGHAELPLGIRHCGVGVIEDEAVTVGIGMDVINDLEWDRLGFWERDRDSGAIHRLENKIAAGVEYRLSMNIDRGGRPVPEDNRLTGSRKERVRAIDGVDVIDENSDRRCLDELGWHAGWWLL